MKGTGSPNCCSFSDPRLKKRGHFYFGESGHFHFGTTSQWDRQNYAPCKKHCATVPFERTRKIGWCAVCQAYLGCLRQPVAGETPALPVMCLSTPKANFTESDHEDGVDAGDILAKGSCVM